MRKFPIYNLAQEITMQMMMLLIIMGYIAYDQLDVLGTLGYAVIAVAAAGIIFFFTRQLKNMIIAKVISQTKHKKFATVKTNWLLIITSNVVIIGLSLLHFYIWIQQGKNLAPLYNEYGIGALLGIGLFIVNSRDFSIITTDQGIAFGSKFDLKLLLWEDIHSVKYEGNNIIIIPKNTVGFKSLRMPKEAISRDLESLLRMNVILDKRPLR
jgi:hypothetical protein